MKKKVFAKLLMALLVTGLFLTVSCAQKNVIENQITESDQTSDQGTIPAKKIQENQIKPVATGNPNVDFINLDIYFDFDSDELSAESQAILQSKAAYLQKNSKINVIIEGHCDERGTTEYNLALGERRAMTAKNFLVDIGIPAARLNIISYGEEQPVDTSHNKDAWERNRRAHFDLR